MNIETANAVLTNEQVSIAAAHGRRSGAIEADKWFEQNEDATVLPEWEPKPLKCSPTELCGVELSDEQSEAFEFLFNVNARDAWGEFERV
ncbi:hypothetical protein [Schlesneria sp. T3-172]|uniref:hypothetical protein n=1 Tax=Schlesneria sphaerica TaxID=3373610 RepID=UPI0037C55FD5